MQKRNSIATRILALYLLLGCIAISFMVSTTFSFQKLTNSVERVSTEQIPTIAAASLFAEIGGQIATDATNLMLAKDKVSLTSAYQRLTTSLPKLSQFSQQGIVPESHHELIFLKEAITENISSLNINARLRLTIQSQKEEKRQLLHWMQIEFIDEITPLINDSIYNLNLLIKRLSQNRTLTHQEIKTLGTQSDIRHQLLTLETNINLVFDLLQRSTLLSTRSEILSTQSVIDETFFAIKQQLHLLVTIPSTVTIRQIAEQLNLRINDSNNVIQVSLKALQLQEANKELLLENQYLIQRVKLIVTQAVIQAQHDTESSIQALSDAMVKSQKNLTITIICVAVLSLVVGWYLKSQLLNRLSTILRSMRHLAMGETLTPTQVRGNDELAKLSQATQVFNTNALRIQQYTQQLEQTNDKLKEEIAHRVQTENDLRNTQNELTQASKLAMLGQLTAGIVHEFSQPLAAIKSNTYLANQYLEQQQFDSLALKLEKINNITDRATKLCQHLKSFSRKSSGKLSSTSLNRVVEDSISLFTDTQITDQWFALTIDDSHSVLADPIRLEQVIVNLISNAIDAIKVRQQHQTLTPLIQIHSSAINNEQIVLTITDNGCGIDSDRPQNIFEPFYTTKEVGEGLGLGMSISHNIIKDFGGNITLSSQINQGTEIRLCLIKHT
ncbi:ATP-binding protein [Aliivibrio kagoshimensis]|uniref:ATP-binding protein n=1 Tax=Aliivibrio kagoshimensis TaxID=2910230 RepID=UPI003D0FA46B